MLELRCVTCGALIELHNAEGFTLSSRCGVAGFVAGTTFSFALGCSGGFGSGAARGPDGAVFIGVIFTSGWNGLDAGARNDES